MKYNPRFVQPLILIVFLFAVASFSTSCKDGSKKENTTTVEKVLPAPEKAENAELSMEVYYCDTLGWGYDIYRNGKPYIHQPHIPGISGLKGFKSERDAMAVGNLVMEKIRNNILPPGVSIEEMKELKIVLNE